jgi:hypothetical protein
MDSPTVRTNVVDVPSIEKILLGLHSKACAEKLFGRIVLIYHEGGLRCAKIQHEENVDLKTVMYRP